MLQHTLTFCHFVDADSDAFTSSGLSSVTTSAEGMRSPHLTCSSCYTMLWLGRQYDCPDDQEKAGAFCIL